MATSSRNRASATTRARTRVRIGFRSAGLLMTPEEFDAVPESVWDDRYHYELIRGVLVVSPPVSNAEVDPNEYLGYLLLSYQESHANGSALDATMPERTVPTTKNRRRCDRAIWAGLRRTPDTDTDVPTIIIEFVSTSRRDAARDYEEKRDEYRAAGVREYWIIDRFRRTMTVHKNGPEGPAIQIVAEGQDYETDLLPGFVLPLARLLGRADRWKKTKTKPRPQPNRPTKPTPPAGETDG